MHLCADHRGSWVGTNRFRLMPDDAPAESEATAELSLGAGENVAVLRYSWAHPGDGVQEGVLMIGSGADPDVAVGLWGDSWHQKPGAAELRGSFADSSVTVGYSYAEGWEWRITISVEDPDVLRLRMDNVVPASASAASGAAEGVTYWAMDAELRRS